MNTTTTETRKDFDAVKRQFEQAHASGNDYAAPLYDLATAIAYSVLNKCLDPQRKTAATRDAVSDNGNNPALLAVKRGMVGTGLQSRRGGALDSLHSVRLPSMPEP